MYTQYIVYNIIIFETGLGSDLFFFIAKKLFKIYTCVQIVTFKYKSNDIDNVYIVIFFSYVEIPI